MLLEFTLRKRGMRMDYRVMRPKVRGSVTMLAEVSEKSPFPPTGMILDCVSDLRVYVAKALGMWYDGFDVFVENGVLKPFSYKDNETEYMKARNTLDAIDIVTVVFKGGYRFISMVESIPGKFVKMRTPLITEDDELFDEVDGIMSKLRDMVVEFIEDSSYDVRQEAKSIVKRLVGVESMSTMTDKEIFVMAIERIEELGGVVMYSEELEKEITDAKSDLAIEKSVSKDEDVSIAEVTEEVADWAKSDRDYEKRANDFELKPEDILPELKRENPPSGWEEEGDRDPDNTHFTDGGEPVEVEATDSEGDFI